MVEVTQAPYRLKRGKRGFPRVSFEQYEGWIARGIDGVELTEPGFRWNTRSGAWHVALEDDIFDGAARRAQAIREQSNGA